MEAGNSHAGQQQGTRPRLSKRALGLLLIFLTAIIWVAASFISQLLVSHEEGRRDFNVSPFLLTYLSTSVFTIFLPLVQLKALLTETWLLRWERRRRARDGGRAARAAALQQQQQQLAA